MSEMPSTMVLPLPWEDQASNHPWAAYRRTMWVLLARPSQFYDRMATRGGLHEPVTFLLATLTTGVVLSFLAALAHTGLAAPGTRAASSQQYFLLTLAPKATGLAVALLPELLLGTVGLLVVAGSLFHLGVRPFGGQPREASVSILFYGASAALVPLLAALAVVFLVCGAGWLAQALRGAPLPALHTVGMWTWRILLGLGALAACALFVGHCIVGCARASDLDGILAAAAGLFGLLMTMLVPLAAVVLYYTAGARAGAIGLAVGCALALAVALWQGVVARRARYCLSGDAHG